MSMQKLPTAILAGFLTLIMPVMLNTIVVNPAIAQTDTDTDTDIDTTDTDTDIDTTDTDTDTDIDTTDTDTDTDTPVGGIETGAGGTATEGVN